MPYPNYTKEEIIDDIYGNTLRCKWCKYHSYPRFDGDKDYKQTCKRLDHVTVKFAKPWFAEYTADYFACKDFEPNQLYKLLYENWTSFDDYVAYYRLANNGKNPYSDITVEVKGYNNCRFRIKADDYLNGTMFDENGNLKAYDKYYYKIVRNPDPKHIPNELWYPYRIIHEPIEYVEISNNAITTPFNEEKFICLYCKCVFKTSKYERKCCSNAKFKQDIYIKSAVCPNCNSKITKKTIK